jgi:DNA replication protein DnaD
MKGYVKIHRELLEHPIWTSEKFTRGQAWVDLITKANAKPGWVRKRGARIDLNRGDVGYSIKELSRQWDWSESKTRRFLKELEDDEMVTLKKTNVSCTITLVNYDMWQSDEWQMRRGNNSSNGAQSNEQTNNKRYPNNKEKKTIRKKEESENALSPTNVALRALYTINTYRQGQHSK